MMQLTETIRDGHTVLCMSGELTIFDVASVKDGFIQYVQDYAYLEVDLSDVVAIDTAGLQLLILIKKEAKRKSHTLFFKHHSREIKEIASFLHMELFFDMDDRANEA